MDAVAAANSGRRRRQASEGLCKYLLDMPDTFIDLKRHYMPFGFMDAATAEGMLATVRPFLSTLSRPKTRHHHHNTQAHGRPRRHAAGRGGEAAAGEDGGDDKEEEKHDEAEPSTSV